MNKFENWWLANARWLLPLLVAVLGALASFTLQS